MKKFLVCLLAMVMIALTSCGDGNTGTNNGTSDTVTIVFEPNETVDTTTAKPDSLVQCHAITKKGTQCERLVNYPDTLCFQHKKMQ